jgi:hypothetical protein
MGDRYESVKSEFTQSMNFYYVDSDFIHEYKIDVIAGRPFQKKVQTDIENTFILNEMAAKAFGFSSLEESMRTLIAFIYPKRIWGVFTLHLHAWLCSYPVWVWRVCRHLPPDKGPRK